MARRKSRISDKMVGILLGIAITLSAVGIIGTMSVSYAHSRDTSTMMDGQESMMGDAMSDNEMPMMHSMNSMMMGGDGMMECMKIMKQTAGDGEVTQEEMEGMMLQMDKDSDGQCDYCGMSIEMCRRMTS